MMHSLRPCDTCGSCHQRKVSGKWSKSNYMPVWCKILSIYCKALSKKKRNVEWEESSHGLVRQNEQSIKCSV